MNDLEINQMYLYDLKIFNSTRRYIEHTQELTVNYLLDDSIDEGKSLLNKKFINKMSITDQYSIFSKKFNWIEEIESLELRERLSNLSYDEKLLLTMYVFDELSQSEIANIIGLSQRGVSKKIQKIIKKLIIF